MFGLWCTMVDFAMWRYDGYYPRVLWYLKASLISGWHLVAGGSLIIFMYAQIRLHTTFVRANWVMLYKHSHMCWAGPLPPILTFCLLARSHSVSSYMEVDSSFFTVSIFKSSTDNYTPSSHAHGDKAVQAHNYIGITTVFIFLIWAYYYATAISSCECDN